MPLRDLFCECGWWEDDVVIDNADLPAARCPECGSGVRRRVGVPNIGGVALVTTFGRGATTEKEANAQAAGEVVLEGSAKQAYVDRVRERGEKAAREMGYRDLEHRRADCRAMTNDRSRIAREGRKPFLLPK